MAPSPPGARERAGVRVGACSRIIRASARHAVEFLARSAEREKRRFVVVFEGQALGVMLSQEILDGTREAVTPPDPDHRRRRAQDETPLLKVGVP